MITIFYNGTKIISLKDNIVDCLTNNLKLLEKSYEALTGRDYMKDVFKFLISEFEGGNEDILDMDKDDLCIEFWGAIMYGYEPCEGFTVSNDEDPETKTETKDDSDDDDDGKLKIVIPGAGTLFTADAISPRYTACGCPMCGGYLRVIGQSKRLEMPDLYFSICDSCNAQIGFSEKDKKYFPLTETKPEKKM